jgi:hypothetical protein
VSTDIAHCISPDAADMADPEQSGIYDVIEYSVSELALNVIQHAKATGFAMAQYMPRTDLVRVAIADSGIGILQSFAENAAPIWKAEWTDTDAIRAALQPKVSSKLHLTSAWGGEPINAGVGLTLLKELSVQTGGHFFLASGKGFFLQMANNTPQFQNLPNHFQGTICVLAFVRGRISNYPTLMQQAKQSLGLLPSSEKFDRLFQ